jgi:beta-galactosidase
MITKTALELGVTSFNYYMGFGGTNFDWAAKKLTTTYDYAAPIREPGGLGDKYYAVRGIGQSLRVLGSVLARAAALPGVQCTNENVSVSERTNGPSAVLFVRENSNAPQRYKMTFTDSHSPSKRFIFVPRQGELELRPREMKMLPVQIKVSGGRLVYSTGEMLTHGVNLDRDFLILYDLPGRILEMGLATEDEPQLEGDTAYRYWDPEYETSVLGVQVGTTEKMLLYREHLQIFVVPRDKALRTFLWEFPPKIVPGSEETKTVVAPILTDAYALVASGTVKSRAWVDLEFLPGQHDVAVMLPPLPVKCRLDDVLTDFQYDRPWHLARVHVTTPPLPYQPINLSAGDAWVEKFDPGAGEWLTGPLHALEDLGPVPYGYVKYRTPFNFNGEPRMFIATRADDAKRVFVNGKFVAEASNTEKLTDFPLAQYAQPGVNLVEISYELFGAPNFGEHLGELKGLESAGIGADFASAKGLESWQIQRHAPLLRGREINPEAGLTPTEGAGRTHPDTGMRPAGEGWTPASFLRDGGKPILVPAFTWCRAKFTLPPPDEAWKTPWKLAFDADCDALLFLNGKFVGRYATIGPQREFYLPEPYLSPDGENILMFALAYTNRPGHLRKLQVSPYAEFSARRTRLEFEW